MTIKDICDRFYVKGDYVSCKEISTGNINNTYLVRFIENGNRESYILQRINKKVFTKPERVMDNIVKVTDYIRDGIEKKGLPVSKLVLNVFREKETAAPFTVDNFGDYWRCYQFIENSETYDSSSDLFVIREVGRAFGVFQNALDGFDARSLFITIPDFHNTPKRYAAFIKSVKKDAFKRVSEVKKEIDGILAFKEKACELQRLLDSGEIPCRVTHNDTKCNNVCFDRETKKSLAVLDLDTIMPGAIAFDFGDAVRSIASSSEEDDPDLRNVRLDLDKYEAFARGFVTEVKDKLTETEKKTLNDGAITLTVELAMRFLNDYIDGDKYFKTRYPGHNLDRARNQLALAEDMTVKKTEMDCILSELLRS